MSAHPTKPTLFTLLVISVITYSIRHTKAARLPKRDDLADSKSTSTVMQQRLSHVVASGKHLPIRSALVKLTRPRRMSPEVIVTRQLIHRWMRKKLETSRLQERHRHNRRKMQKYTNCLTTHPKQRNLCKSLWDDLHRNY